MAFQRLRKIEFRPGACLRLELTARVAPRLGESFIEESTLVFSKCRRIEISLRGDEPPLMQSVLEEVLPPRSGQSGESDPQDGDLRPCSHYRLEFDMGHISVMAARYSHCITRTEPVARVNSANDESGRE